ncbi:MAG: DUF29 family protein [Cyanobacteria bacterium RI_101]|nr:DUF29 family protein [Cyanobacteria bacterium RI_101]
MVAELRKIDKSLYETDYNLWVLETVDKLQRRELGALDWENLIEEVIDLSRRDKKKLKSLLRLLVEHLLKLTYWENEIENNRGHWEAEITNFRKLIQDELTDSPSLKRYLQEVWQECYQDGREIAAKRSSLPLSAFPETPIANLEQALDKDWFPGSLED